MKRWVLDCDKCKSEDRECHSFSVAVGRRSDAAGSIETVTCDFDLCTKCMASAIYTLLNVDSVGLIKTELITKIAGIQVRPC